MHTPDGTHLLFFFSKNTCLFSLPHVSWKWRLPGASICMSCSQDNQWLLTVFETAPFKLFCLLTPHVYQVTPVSWESRSSEWPAHGNVNLSVFDHNRLVIIPVAKLICELCQHCSLGFGLISLPCGFVLSFLHYYYYFLVLFAPDQLIRVWRICLLWIWKFQHSLLKPWPYV